MACGPALLGAVTEVVTYMKNRIKHAPKKPAFLAELEWTEGYMEVLKSVEVKSSAAIATFEFSEVTLTSMRKVLCMVGAMETYWKTLKQTFGVNEKQQTAMTEIETTTQTTLMAGVEHIDKAIQLEQMKMLTMLAVAEKKDAAK